MHRIKRLRLICVTLAIISFGVGAERMGEVALVAHDPLWLVTNLRCDDGHCQWTADPLDLLGPVKTVPFADQPRLTTAIAARAKSPPGHRMLVAAELARALPLVALYWMLGLALLALSRSVGVDPVAIRWLRRAATAAAVLVLAKPVAYSLQATAILPAIDGDNTWRFSIIGTDVPSDLLLAGAAWVAAWAIEQGLTARTELAEYV